MKSYIHKIKVSSSGINFTQLTAAWNEAMREFQQYKIKEKDYKIIIILEYPYHILRNDFGLTWEEWIKKAFPDTDITYIPNLSYDNFIRIIAEPKDV